MQPSLLAIHPCHDATMLGVARVSGKDAVLFQKKRRPDGVTKVRTRAGTADFQG